jgi:hypothetical protein
MTPEAAPRTAAGRALLATLNGSYPRTEPHPEHETWIARATREQYEIDCAAILAIEAEAAAGTALEHRSAEGLGHLPEDGVLFHLALCERCDLMLAYLVRDQVECVARLAGESASAGNRPGVEERDHRAVGDEGKDKA